MSSSKTLATSLAAIEDPNAQCIINTMCARAMRRAMYVCASCCPSLHHYALNVPFYTHFTSPIRRYADIMTHRMLMTALRGKTSYPLDKHTIKRIAAHCNQRKDHASDVQDYSSKLYLTHYLYGQPRPVECDAVVAEVRGDVIEMVVPDYGLEACVFVRQLPVSKMESLDGGLRNVLRLWWKRGVQTTAESEDADLGNIVYPNGEEDDDEGTSEFAGMRRNMETMLKLDEDGEDEGDPATTDLSAFDTIRVRLVPVVRRSPPFIHVLPLNPFA